MPFIKLHGIDGEEVLVNTETITFIQKITEGKRKSQINFNVPIINDKDRCIWAKVTETIDEIADLIENENNRT